MKKSDFLRHCLLLSYRSVGLLLCCSVGLLLCCSIAPAAPFTYNGNGTVTDSKTGLMWQQGEPGYMAWDSALSYCEGLSLGGHSGWRLPNIKELESLTDDTRWNPAIDTAFFPNAYASSYWSSTTDAGSPSYAWLVYFYDGHVYSLNKSYVVYVRCVRGGQSGSFGDLDHFEFSFISSPQSVGVPFNVTITARDASGNVVSNWKGRIYLNSTIGKINPIYADISSSGSVMINNVTIDSPGNNAQIKATGSGKSGASNYFNVTGVNANNGFISGIVTDSDKNKLTGAVVYLDNGVNYFDQSTVNGKYQFTNLPCGEYIIHASYNGTDSRTYNVPVSCDTPVTMDLLIATCNPNNTLTPILLVPGFGGSSTGEGGIYPTLSDEYLDLDSSKWVEKSWGLHDPAKN